MLSVICILVLPRMYTDGIINSVPSPQKKVKNIHIQKFIKKIIAKKIKIQKLPWLLSSRGVTINRCIAIVDDPMQ